MDHSSNTKFKEVPLLKQDTEYTGKSIEVSCGGYPTILVDSKTSELSGGSVLDGTYAGRQHDGRFIYWRTFRETVYFTETCLHRNDFWHEVGITFKGSPILAVALHNHIHKNFFILIATTTSFHRIPIKRLSSIDGSNFLVEQDSVLLKLNEHIITDPMNCFIFINEIGQLPPMVASVMHCTGSSNSFFAIATDTSVHLCTMGSAGDKPDVKFVELEIPAPGITQYTESRPATDFVTVCLIATSGLKEEPLLFTLRRDGVMRIWLHSGQLLASENLYKHTDGGKTEFHSCISRGSKSLIALFVSFKTFSEFVIFRPTVKGDAQTCVITSLTLQKVCTIAAPQLDLIDFNYCEFSLWSLWCNSDNQMQTMVHNIASYPNCLGWRTVIMANESADDLPPHDGGIDLQEFYCKRIFNTRLFPPIAIKKTYVMFKDQLNGRESGPSIGNMARLKRDVIACIKNQLKKEQATIDQHASYDSKQELKISNQLWEKFYRYCVQIRDEASRPIGLFLYEEFLNATLHISVGLVRKQFVSFFRMCDRLESLYYSQQPVSCNESSENIGLRLLVKYLKATEESMTHDQKEELDTYLHHQQVNTPKPSEEKNLHADFCIEPDPSVTESYDDLEDLPEVITDGILHLSAAQDATVAHNVMHALVSTKIDLVAAICTLLRCITPNNGDAHPVEEKDASCVSVHTGQHLYSELALATTKQKIDLRYMLLRNLSLLQSIIRSLESEDKSDTINKMLVSLHPRIDTLLCSYHLMDWIANTRLVLDWARKRVDIVKVFPTSQRNTQLTLLQAYARCRLNNRSLKPLPSHVGLDVLLEPVGDCYTLSLNQKAEKIISYLSPMHDNFRFGEWLSENELSLHIDDYVELSGIWCSTNESSRTLIRAKSCLVEGDTSKALELFIRAHEGMHNDRYMLMFLRNDKNGEQRSVSPYEISPTYFLQVIRLFESYGAHDAVPWLVRTAIEHTPQPQQRAMFEHIAFSSCMALERYNMAYESYAANEDPTRKMNCLRQLITKLLSTRRLELLLELPFETHLLDISDLVLMNARSADTEEQKMYRYKYLFSFYASKLFMRDAADISYEEAMRYINENATRDQLELYCNALLRCILCLSILPEQRAWVAPQLIANAMAEENLSANNKLEVLDLKKLHEKLVIVHSVFSLSESAEDTKLLASLEPNELVILMMRRKKYNRALQLAHCSVPSLVPTVYGHLVKACVAASSGMRDSSSNADTALAWLHENCTADVPVGADSASTAWNYLQYMLSSEPDELASDIYLALLVSMISCDANIPLWLHGSCFKHCPIQLVRTYWRHGRLKEAHECMLELLKLQLLTLHTDTPLAALPVALVERMYYDLEQAPNHTKENFDQYLRKIEESM